MHSVRHLLRVLRHFLRIIIKLDRVIRTGGWDIVVLLLVEKIRDIRVVMRIEVRRKIVMYEFERVGFVKILIRVSFPLIRR